MPPMPTNETIIPFSGAKLARLPLLALGCIRRILKNSPGLVIDNTGFTDYSSGLAAGYISWTEVKGLKTITLYKKQLVSVILKNPDAFLDRQPNALKRKAMTVNFRNYGSPIQLSPNSLQCSFDELLNHLQTHFDRSRPSVLN